MDSRNDAVARYLVTLAADSFRVLPSEIMAHGRTQPLVWARFAAIWLTHRYTGCSLQAIGDFFGGRHHTTIIHALQQVEAWREMGDMNWYDLRRAERAFCNRESVAPTIGQLVEKAREVAGIFADEPAATAAIDMLLDKLGVTHREAA